MNYSDYKAILMKDRNAVYGQSNHTKLYFMNAGYKIIIHFRRCQFLKSKKYLYPIYMFERFIFRRICVKYGCDLPSGISVGSGFRIDHPWGVVINSKTSIGTNCTIKTGVVIGNNSKGVPSIGNNVLIGAHALVIGNINIGNNVRIGAGAIVTHDVPDNCTVVCKAATIKEMRNCDD